MQRITTPRAMTSARQTDTQIPAPDGSIGSPNPRASGVVLIDRGVPSEPDASPPVQDAALRRRFAIIATLMIAYGFAMGLAIGTLLRKPRTSEPVETVRLAVRRRPPPPVVAMPAATAPALSPPAPPLPAPSLPAPPPPVARPSGGGASGDAEGLSYAAVMAVVREHDDRVQDCMRHVHGSAPIRAGRVPVTVVVEPNGVVRNAGHGVADRSQVRALGCLTSAIKRWRFPPTGRSRDHGVIIPFDLH